MDPASVYSFSRSRYTSANRSSSTMPTLVSCGVEDTNNSFVIETPVRGRSLILATDSPDEEKTGRSEVAVNVQPDAANCVSTKERCGAWDFGPSPGWYQK